MSDLDSLLRRLQALRARTVENGCTEGEALAAAEKVAELLDRHDLSLSDLEIRAAPCERRAYETHLRKRIPLDECIGAIAAFCDCKVWWEKQAYVFFGLKADVEVAHYLTGLVDGAVRTELGRYKNSAEYKSFRHQERHVANASFALGMVASIADRLTAMKEARDRANESTGRSLVVVKSAVVESELAKLDLQLRSVEAPRRMVSPDAYDAGGVAGERVPIHPAVRGE